MRFYGLALVASAVVLTACSGGDKKNDSAAAVDSSNAMAPAAGTATTSATTGGTAAPITGTTHEVKMIGDEKGYRFEPADITIKAGDGIKWVMVSGGPHNVAFDQAALGGAATQIGANMPNPMAPLASPYLTQPNENYTISFANVAPGKYEYVCQPHAAMNMKGSITVQ